MNRIPRPEGANWQSLTEALPEEFLAPIDRVEPHSIQGVDHHLFPKGMTKSLWDWHQDGVLYLPNFLPEDLIDQYCWAWHNQNGAGKFAPEKIRMGGWPYDTPYLHVPELRKLCLYPPLMDAMKDLIGDEMGLHLNLTGWVTTARDFHQDSYLNPEFVGSRYAAVWMALGDISEDSGPFQFIPGSHRWPVIRQHKLFQFLTPEQKADPAWPATTQEWVADICLEEARKRKAEVQTYTPKKGDVLIWHSQLVHRGSPALKPGYPRKACIAHYSALSARSDMPRRAQDENGKWFFVFDHEHK